MNVQTFLDELRREHRLIEEAIALLERLLYSRGSGGGRPPGRANNSKIRRHGRIKAKSSGEEERVSHRPEE